MKYQYDKIAEDEKDKVVELKHNEDIKERKKRIDEIEKELKELKKTNNDLKNEIKEIKQRQMKLKQNIDSKATANLGSNFCIYEKLNNPEGFVECARSLNRPAFEWLHYQIGLMLHRPIKFWNKLNPYQASSMYQPVQYEYPQYSPYINCYNEELD